MAAVTVASTPSNQRHVAGDLVTRYFAISGVTGSTLVTGLLNIQFVDVQQSTQAGTASLITSFSVSGGTITFNSSAPMVNEVIGVTGREG